MRKIIFLLLIMILAGCKSTVGPLASRDRKQGPDPLLTDEEQLRQVRERYPYLEDSRLYAPNSFTDRPGVMGR